jgi:hypothetical protein
MTLDIVFLLSNLLVMPFWALMIVLPHWHWTKLMIASPLIALPVAFMYIVLVAPQLTGILGAVGNPDLATIAGLLGTPAGATIAWIHFLTFDLFVGRWIYLDSRERRISALLMAPVLFLTLMLGPFGLTLYLIGRSFKRPV